MPTKIAIIGLGKIAQDQHLPAIEASTDWELAATVSRNNSVSGIKNYTTLNELLTAQTDIKVISLCVPPAPRFELAVAALNAGRHLILEKPPGATLAECDILVSLAASKGLSIYATWHSREAQQVDAAAAWLADKQINHFSIIWREDVRRWHPNQEWIWQPGGMGVFDPGINALSILTRILPEPVRLVEAELSYPENRQTPIAAKLVFATLGGTPGEADFDWREQGGQTWTIRVETDAGVMDLESGGELLKLNGKVVASPRISLGEYPRLYKKMYQLYSASQSEVDLRPLQLVSDAFALGSRCTVLPFNY